MNSIKRLHGVTGVKTETPEEIADIIYKWGWLLPLSGMFTFDELIIKIGKTYDNPRADADTETLKEYTSLF